MNKVEVKRLITACQDLNVEQKSRLRSLLDQNVVGVDSMITSDGTLISIPELLLVITDNTTNSKEKDDTKAFLDEVMKESTGKAIILLL